MTDRDSKPKYEDTADAGLRKLARAWAEDEGRALLAERDLLNREGPAMLLPRADARVKAYVSKQRASRHRRNTWIAVAACLAVYLALPQALIAARESAPMYGAAPAAPMADAAAAPAAGGAGGTGSTDTGAFAGGGDSQAPVAGGGAGYAGSSGAKAAGDNGGADNGATSGGANMQTPADVGGGNAGGSGADAAAGGAVAPQSAQDTNTSEVQAAPPQGEGAGGAAMPAPAPAASPAPPQNTGGSEVQTDATAPAPPADEAPVSTPAPAAEQTPVSAQTAPPQEAVSGGAAMSAPDSAPEAPSFWQKVLDILWPWGKLIALYR